MLLTLLLPLLGAVLLVAAARACSAAAGTSPCSRCSRTSPAWGPCPGWAGCFRWTSCQHAQGLLHGRGAGHGGRRLPAAELAAPCGTAGHAAAGRAGHRRRSDPGRPAAAGRRDGRLCAGGRAAAAPDAAAPPAHERGRDEEGIQGDGRQRRGQGPPAPAHARTLQPPHAGRRAAGRPGGDEPDPLRGGAALRRNQDGRAACGGQGRRPAGVEDPRLGAGCQGARAAGAAPGPRAVRAHRSRPGSPGAPVQPPWRRCWPGSTRCATRWPRAAPRPPCRPCPMCRPIWTPSNRPPGAAE
jgi:hypothetical protein